MKCTTFAACVAALLLTACNNAKKTDEPKPDKDTTQTTTAEVKEVPAPQLDSATMMKNMAMSATPGEEHKMLAKMAGNWTTEITGYWVPGGAPVTSKGTAVNKMILGGRYQQQNATGNIMGMAFQGVGTTGFDNAKKVFTTSWIDNMGTGIMNLQGPWDAATKSITLTGKAVDGATLKESDYKEILKIIDDDNQVLEMYGPGHDGKEYKMMEIKYKRKK